MPAIAALDKSRPSLHALQKHQVAYTMLLHSVRPFIVSAATGVTRDRTKRMWYEIHGKGPSKGPGPENSYHYLVTKNDVSEASTFALLYQRFRTVEGMYQDIVGMIQAYKYFRSLAPWSDLSMQAAWYITRDLQDGLIEQRFCRRCRLHYIPIPERSTLRDCVFCT